MSEAYSVVVCINRRYGSPSCAARGGVELADELERQLAELGLAVPVQRVECLGQCEQGPNMRIAPGGLFFHEVTMDDLPVVIGELTALFSGGE